MKFTLNQRRISNKAQTTSEFMEEDRFAGIQHHTQVDIATADQNHGVTRPSPRTPKRVLDQLDETPMRPPPTDPRVTRARTHSPAPVPRSARNATQPTPVSSPPRQPDAANSEADETNFEIQPAPLPVTGERVLDQGLEISALHTRAQRERGFRKRGHVAYTQYTYDPGQGINYKNYVDQLYTGSPVEHYTQVLIWCINSRLAGLRNQPDIGARDQAAINALNTLISNLARGEVSINWTRQTFTNLPAETELAPNPANTHNMQQVKVLKNFLADLKKENKGWMELLEKTDEPVAPAAHGAPAAPTAAAQQQPDTATIKLPEVDVDKGLEAVSAKVAGLEVDVDIAQETIQRQLPQTAQPPTLLSALGLL